MSFLDTLLEWEAMRVKMAIANGHLEAIEIDGDMWYTHPSNKCAGEYCAIHNPSDHNMVTWRRWLRETGLVERLCPKHGVGHPDPDSVAWFDANVSKGYDVHGCCGCCS